MFRWCIIDKTTGEMVYWGFPTPMHAWSFLITVALAGAYDSNYKIRRMK